MTPAEIMADMESIARAIEAGYTFDDVNPNIRLEEAIERCFEAEANLPAIINAVPQEDPDDRTAWDAYEWKKDYIRKQVTRAGQAARERKARLATIRTEGDQQAELAYCEGLTESDPENALSEHERRVRGMLHWFRYYAWAYDPRSDYLPLQPFVPFGLYDDDEADEDFQVRYLVWIEETAYLHNKSGTVKKPRDIGATLGFLLWTTYRWLFSHYFSALLASANEDLVDKTGDQNTLFEKVRFGLRLVPNWMLPPEFDLVKDMPFMRLSNPANGSTIGGQAPTINAARQKRAKVVLCDEMAAWPYGGFPQSTSLSFVAKSIFQVSTVQGRFNAFAQNLLSGKANVFEVRWDEHPWKDERWFNALGTGDVGNVMTTAQIAQEVLCDMDASQPGKVFGDWEETRTCIEWAELMAFYKSVGLEGRFRHVDGTWKIPEDCHWARMQDKGETEGHPRMTLWCFRPGEAYPLNDSTFFFAEYMAPTAADLDTVVKDMTEIQRRWHLNERRPQHSLISHEAKKDRGIYTTKFGWHWNAWDTDYDSGIGNIRLWLKPADLHKPNPIRPALMGRTRVYLISGTGQSGLYYNEKLNKHDVTTHRETGSTMETLQGRTDGLTGFPRLRAEMPVYHYPPEELGKPVQDQRPVRFFEDAIVCVRSIALKYGPSPKAENQDEKRNKRLAPEIQKGAIAQLPMGSPERDAAILSQSVWLAEFKQEEEMLSPGIGPMRIGTGPMRRN